MLHLRHCVSRLIWLSHLLPSCVFSFDSCLCRFANCRHTFSCEYVAIFLMDLSSAPHSIVQYWHEADPPPLLQVRMDQRRSANPGFRHLVFNRVFAATALQALYGDSFWKAFLAIRLPAMQADVFRVAYLYASGGTWIDAATHCLAPLRQWLDLGAQLVMLRKPGMIPPLVCNWIIYVSVPQHPVAGEALNRITDVITNRLGGWCLEAGWRRHVPRCSE